MLNQERERMVATQIEARGITDPLVLDAMRTVPRERFVSASLAKFAHDDGPLPIGHDQTISQPYIVVVMARASGLKPGTRVLEIGTGSGYSAAVLSRIAAEVYTVERVGVLDDAARACLAELGYGNVHLREGDGTLGWPAHAPYDAIVVTAGGPRVPGTLPHQLAVGGRLVMPVGPVARHQGHGEHRHLGPHQLCERHAVVNRHLRQEPGDRRDRSEVAGVSCEGLHVTQEQP